jgi:phasin
MTFMMQPTRFEIPENVRTMAEQSVDQAKKAFEQVLEVTQKAVASAEESARSLREGATEVNRQTLAFVEENVTASLDFAGRLVQARTLEEVAALQQEFLRRQMTAASEQGRHLGTMMTKASANATKSTSRK